MALFIALWADSGVFSLVLIAWSVLASALGPLLLVRLARQPLPAPIALAMMAVGVLTVVLWDASPWAESVFKALPGMVAPLVVYGAWRVFARGASPHALGGTS